MNATQGLKHYVKSVSDTHGIKGCAILPGGGVVYADYSGDDYDLYTDDGKLTDADGSLTHPQYLNGRGSILALRDKDGSERHDLVEVNMESGDITPILDDEFLNHNARQSPTVPERIAFVSNRDQSLDLYTVDIESNNVTRHSEPKPPVWGYAWSPEGDRIVYQSGSLNGNSLRLVDLDAGTDEVFVDEANSEQSLGSVLASERGHGAWSEEGIVFSTNHETGYNEIAVADETGDYELRHVTQTDKYDACWTADGDIAFVEPNQGNRVVKRLNNEGVETVEDEGAHKFLKPVGNSLYYTNHSPSEVGDLKRDGETVVVGEDVDVQTVAPEEVTYESFDGQTISARCYTPEGEPVGSVVNIHGGPPRQHYNRLEPVTQTLVQAGFEVLCPDYRGSLGYGRSFRKASDHDMGGVDLDDIAAAATYLREERGHSTVGVIGGSYGGYLTLMAMANTDAFDAGVSLCGIVNWETLIKNARGFLGGVYTRKMGGSPADLPELYEGRSPITHVDDIDAPLLVVQGANDPRVPQKEAEQIVSSLDDRDVEYDYLLFEDEGHGVVKTENRVEYLSNTVSLFKEYVSDD